MLNTTTKNISCQAHITRNSNHSCAHIRSRQSVLPPYLYLSKSVSLFLLPLRSFLLAFREEERDRAHFPLSSFSATLLFIPPRIADSESQTDQIAGSIFSVTRASSPLSLSLSFSLSLLPLSLSLLLLSPILAVYACIPNHRRVARSVALSFVRSASLSSSRFEGPPAATGATAASFRGERRREGGGRPVSSLSLVPLSVCLLCSSAPLSECAIQEANTGNWLPLFARGGRVTQSTDGAFLLFEGNVSCSVSEER